MRNAGAGLPLRIRILLLLALHPDGLHAYAIMKELDVSSGSFYPALARLLGSGLLRVIEGPEIIRGGTREPQKVYVVTREGLAHARQVREQMVVPTSKSRTHAHLSTKPLTQT
jgi:DNA-binding PadR family transcriptional regulator